MSGLRIMPCSVQNGKTRYPSEEPNAVPKVANWRNNLTALSQYQNLFFVAYLDKIYVFKPQFPDQALNEKPDLIIDLPQSRPGLQGYLDPTSGHSVNHLIVGDLGNEEIVVVACDDGDIISYSARSISLAIERVVPLADPWFLRNVGASAWGLAIHKEARLLAVSSNTHRVDVFAPALWAPGYREGCNHGEDPDGGYFREPSRRPAVDPWFSVVDWTPGNRYDSTHISLLAHDANIPNIAFCNTDLDPEGRYLLSTDIDGYTFVWDIYRGVTVFSRQGDTRGWGVACLDPRTARVTEELIATFGCKGQIKGKGMHKLVDISEGARFVPDNSRWHPGIPAPATSLGEDPVDILSAIEQASDDELYSADYDAVEVEEMDIGYGEGDDLEDDHLADSIGEGGQVLQGLGHPYGETINDDWYAIIQQESNDLVSAANPGSGTQDAILAAPNLSDSVLASEMTGPAYSGKTFRACTSSELQGLIKPPWWRCDCCLIEDLTSPRKQQQPEHLPFDVLETTVRDVCLLNGIHYFPNARGPSRANPSSDFHSLVLSQEPIHQRIPPILQHYGFIERLNMISQIPELGVIAIGDQAGRVGILTATRSDTHQQSGYKMEYILPFRSQEEKGLRPHKCSTGMVASLMGMAVGPIQGQENWPEPGSAQDTSQDATTGPRTTWGSSRRFRLLMVYSEHTILSYEISRSTDDGILVV